MPSYADKGDHLLLKRSWTKGGRPRVIPIRTDTQRSVLQQVHRLAGKGSLIPSTKNYVVAGGIIEVARIAPCLRAGALSGIDGVAFPECGGTYTKRFND
jgi:hypothetical protein